MGIHYIEDHGASAIVHFRSVYYPDISTEEVEEWTQEYVSHGRYVYSITKNGRLSGQACHGLNPTGPTIMIGDDETVGRAIARTCRRADGHWPKIVTE